MVLFRYRAHCQAVPSYAVAKASPPVPQVLIEIIASPPEIIPHAVWLSHHISLGFREVEKSLEERGMNVNYEAVRQWCLKRSQAFANEVTPSPRTGEQLRAEGSA